MSVSFNTQKVPGDNWLMVAGHTPETLTSLSAVNRHLRALFSQAISLRTVANYAFKGKVDYPILDNDLRKRFIALAYFCRDNIREKRALCHAKDVLSADCSDSILITVNKPARLGIDAVVKVEDTKTGETLFSQSFLIYGRVLLADASKFFILLVTEDLTNFPSIIFQIWEVKTGKQIFKFTDASHSQFAYIYKDKLVLYNTHELIIKVYGPGKVDPILTYTTTTLPRRNDKYLVFSRCYLDLETLTFHAYPSGTKFQEINYISNLIKNVIKLYNIVDKTTLFFDLEKELPLPITTPPSAGQIELFIGHYVISIPHIARRDSFQVTDYINNINVFVEILPGILSIKHQNGFLYILDKEQSITIMDLMHLRVLTKIKLEQRTFHRFDVTGNVITLISKDHDIVQYVFRVIKAAQTSLNILKNP